MALKDVLVKQQKSKPKTWFETISEQLEPEDLEWLIACIKNNKDYSAPYIADKLTEAGYPVSSTTINKIRKQL